MGWWGQGEAREGSFLWLCPCRQLCGAKFQGPLVCTGQQIQLGVPIKV